ncbi:snapalysin family zinc-dependent metalloprotease [Nocardiopsis potens]|uniref:snapalysin family zinc-dependent metalloprotease n=1 Tax=Nocardiopsis potens TaxID=1246458 RepID=UPI00034949E0|nr:snapalysin family zinc-dependent metalloprotease [Nocardiopsis potens]
MLRKSPLLSLLTTAAAACLISVAAPAAAGAATAPQPRAQDDVAVQQTTLRYDDSRAAEFKDAVAAGAESWNAAVDNVELVPAAPGEHAEITVIATDGWPQAVLGPVRPGGSVWIEFGRQAVREGHDTTRIAAHEMGHSLGLPDTKPGPCSQLMSGASGGVGCTNATPNAQERARVELLYGSGAASELPADGRVLVDAP